jgi:sulfide:quinone oxidoreductase
MRATSDAKTVLILGGGVGGIVAARALRRRLGRRHRVVLIDREPRHLYAPSLLWLMVGQRAPASIQRPLEGLARKGIEVRIGEIEHIDPAARTVTVSGQTLEGDFIVLALGAELAPELVPGLGEAGHDFYTLAGAETFRDALESFRQGRIVVLTSAPLYKCPAAPYEAAFLVEDYLRKRGLREAVSVDVYAAEPAPMGVAGPEVSGAVKDMLASRRIPYHPEHQIRSLDGGRLSFTNGTTADFDLLAYVPPHRAPRVVRESALVSATGWVTVDRHTLETLFPGVFAIGDVVSIPLALGKPLPKAGVFAHAEAEVVARRIAHAISGRGEPDRFDGHGACFIEAGAGRAGFGAGDFYAEPKPVIKLHPPGRRWHLAKVLFEKSWLFTKL